MSQEPEYGRDYDIQNEEMDPDEDVPLLQAVDPGVNKPPGSGLSPERIRLIRTTSMVAFYICMGLVSGVISPSILDLMDIFECDLERFNLMMISKTIGLLLGSFLAGFLSNRYRKRTDLILSIAGVTLGVANMTIPWCPNLYVAIVPVALTGLAHGTINVMCCTVTMAEWGEKAPSPINMLHFGFSLGAFLAPPTVAPFLSPQSPDVPWTNVTSSHMDQLLLGAAPKDLAGFELLGNSSGNATSSNTRIYIPFGFQGTIGVIAGIVFLCFFMSGWKYQSAEPKPKDNQDSADEGEESSTTISSKCTTFRVYMGVSILLIYIGIIMRDYSINSFVFYVAVKGPLHMSKTKGAMLNTANNASWVVGRIIGIITTKYLKVHYTVFVGIVGSLILDIVLVFFGLHYEVVLWVVICTIGLMAGPTYPSVMAWANRYVTMDGIMVALVDSGISAGLVIAQYLGGSLVEYHGVIFSFILAAAGAGFLLGIMIVTQIVCHIKGDRFHGQTVNEMTVEDDEPLLE